MLMTPMEVVDQRYQQQHGCRQLHIQRAERDGIGATVNGVTSSDVYDDNGDRVEETVNGTSTYYLYDDNNPTGYDQVIEAKTFADGCAEHELYPRPGHDWASR